MVIFKPIWTDFYKNTSIKGHKPFLSFLGLKVIAQGQIVTYLHVILVGAGQVPSGMINLSSGFRCDAIMPPRASTINETKKLNSKILNLQKEKYLFSSETMFLSNNVGLIK